MSAKSVFDIGMYDGSDTAYYLECGHRVVAVEANPDLVAAATQRFADAIASGRLTCVHGAISPDGEAVELNLSAQDLGSSSVYAERVADRRPMGSISVPGLTLPQLIERHGLPDYLKVDIEGADRLCVLALTEELRPAYLSFELGDDVDELIAHLASVGYRRFKIINQVTFRELANQGNFRDRLARRVMRGLGYDRPLLVRRAGRFFRGEHSSGPAPWCSDGAWRPADTTRERLREARRGDGLRGWYDIHAALD